MINYKAVWEKNQCAGVCADGRWQQQPDNKKRELLQGKAKGGERGKGLEGGWCWVFVCV